MCRVLKVMRQVRVERSTQELVAAPTTQTTTAQLICDASICAPTLKLLCVTKQSNLQPSSGRACRRAYRCVYAYLHKSREKIRRTRVACTG